MATDIMSDNITARLTYGSTMESSHLATLQIPGLSKKTRKIHIFPEMKTSPLLSLVLLCDNVCIITLYKQDISVRKNLQEIIKGTSNTQTGMWEVPLETQKSETVLNSIIDQTNKPELSQYLHTALFIPTPSSLLK